MKAYLDKGDTQVVVTGHAGAGKTLLAAQIHGRARDLSYEIPSESRVVEVEVFEASEWARLVRVLPGQDGFRSHGAVEAFIQSNSLEGVIHVVDYGYVKPRDSVVAETLIRDDGIDTVEKLRKTNLDFEIDQLKTLLTDIKRSYHTQRRPKWIIIAVNKVDLFPDNRTDALQYYHPEGGSAFGNILKKFSQEVGASNIEIYIMQCAAYEQDFKWNNEIVRSLLERQEQNKILAEFTKSMAVIVDNVQ